MANKPVWSEGLLLSQHHMQQQDRYHEALLRERMQGVRHYDWGITDLEIEIRPMWDEPPCQAQRS